MSLIAHYPLVKNAKDNLFHDDISPSFLINTDAPMGGCLETTKKENMLTFDELVEAQEFSISFWLRLKTGVYYDEWQDVFTFWTVNHDTGSSADLRLEWHSTPSPSTTSTNIYIGVFNNGYWTDGGGVGVVQINKDEWTFVSFVSNKTTLDFYINGELVKTIAKKNQTSNISLDGRFILNQNGYKFDIWNLKIFSHNLSPREVKKEYETCVLHYTFDDPMINYENYYSGKNSGTAWLATTFDYPTNVFKEYGFDTAIKFESTVKNNTDNAYWYFCPSNILTLKSLPTDTKLGLSFYAYASNDCDSNILIRAEGNTTLSKSYVSSDQVTNSSTILESSTKGRVVMFHTIVSPNSSGTIQIMFYFNQGYLASSSTGNKFTTGYILVTGISLYRLNDGDDYIEPNNIIGKSPFYGELNDCSGFENHAISSPSQIKLIRDSALGRYAWRTNNDGSSFDFNFPLRTENIECTIEFWVKMYSDHNYSSILVINDYGAATDAIWIALKTENAALWFFTGLYYTSTLLSADFSRNEWHHVACVLSGTTLSWYFDGNFVNSVDNSKPFSVASTLCRLGGYWRSGLQWDTKLDGSLSDFKIFARPLTSEEIYRHYKVKASFLKNGNIISNGLTIHKDLSKGQVSKCGELRSANFSELGLYDMQLKVLDDGSVWGRIFNHNISGGTNLFGSNQGIKLRESGKYSLLYLLNSDDFKSDGKYEFLLEYPLEYPGQYNRWTQTSNPNQSSSVSGYNAIHLDWTGNRFGGIMLKNAECYLKCDTDSIYWFYAIGSRIAWKNGMPGPGSTTAVQEVSLYIRLDNLSIFQNHHLQKIGKTFVSGNYIDET